MSGGAGLRRFGEKFFDGDNNIAYWTEKTNSHIIRYGIKKIYAIKLI